MGEQDNFRAGFQIEGFPFEEGRWSAVPPAKLGAAPYSRICQVEALRGDTASNRGSGWLLSPGQILTVAHADSARVRFPGTSDWHIATIGKIAPGYFASNGTERKCSPADLAMVLVAHDLEIEFSPFAPLGTAPAVAVGCHRGILVEHAGSVAAAGPMRAHNCDTDREHSGCPLFQGSEASAIHVGLFSGSQPFLSGAARDLTGYLNSAVRITPQLLHALEP